MGLKKNLSQRQKHLYKRSKQNATNITTWTLQDASGALLDHSITAGFPESEEQEDSSVSCFQETVTKHLTETTSGKWELFELTALEGCIHSHPIPDIQVECGTMEAYGGRELLAS